MNKINLIVITAILLLTTQLCFAQKFKVKEGDRSVLKGSTETNLAFDYSHVSVGKFDNEEDYIAKKKGDYNKKESGKGDSWEKSWRADKEERFNPEFTALFNKYGEGIKVGNYPTAKYTITVITSSIEPGYNIGISRKNADVDGEVVVTETGHPDKVILRISFTGAVGRTFGGGDYDTGLRIQESYALLGKSLAKFLN
jgi:hypothetical protein